MPKYDVENKKTGERKEVVGYETMKKMVEGGEWKRVWEPVLGKVEGLASDRFKLEDKVFQNRNRAEEMGW